MIRQVHGFPLIALRPVEPWLRPPLHRAKLAQDFTDTLLGHGFRAHQVGRTYRDLSALLLGHLLLETTSEPAAADTPRLNAPDVAPVARLRRLLDAERSGSDFATGIERLIETTALLVRGRSA